MIESRRVTEDHLLMVAGFLLIMSQALIETLDALQLRVLAEPFPHPR